MAVTQNDLNNLEIRIKSDISKEQTELRHEDRKKASNYYFKVDELEKSSAVNSNTLKYMTESIEKLERVVTEWFKEVNQKIDWFQTKFATKEEHKENGAKISKIETALESINLKIAMVSGGFAVIIFLIERYAK